MDVKEMNVGEQINLIDKTPVDGLNTANPALPVFDAVMMAFLKQLDAVDQKITRKLRQSILSQVSLRLSTLAERKSLNAWLTGAADKLDIHLGLVDMQNCLNHAYHSACDYLGPVEADEILEKAVTETEELPIAIEFSPSNFFRK